MIGGRIMQGTPRYWLGLLMFCTAALFTAVLGSLLQHRAIIQQQAATATQGDAFTASLLPPATAYRRASLGY
jgi:hypothetical protein